MATPFRIKRSAVPGKGPSVSDLQLGELALNTYDADLYTLRSRPGIGTDVVKIGGAAISGVFPLHLILLPSTLKSASYCPVLGSKLIPIVGRGFVGLFNGL